MSKLSSKRLIKKNMTRILESYNSSQSDEWLASISGRVRAIIGTGKEDKLNSLVSTIKDMHGTKSITDDEIINYISILEPNLLPDTYTYKTYRLPSTITSDRISRAISELGIDVEYDPDRSTLKASESDAKKILRRAKELGQSIIDEDLTLNDDPEETE